MNSDYQTPPSRPSFMKKKCAMLGGDFCYSKTGGCVFQIKDDKDQEHIFLF